MHRFFLFFVLSLFCISHITFARSDSAFFHVSSSGAPAANLSISLCLNGMGPLSCQYYSPESLNLTITTTIPGYFYSAAGIKMNTSSYTIASGCTPIANGYCLFSVSDTETANISLAINTDNPPWYPSLNAFEHYDSGRSHLFSQATFGGNFSGDNTVNTLASPIDYPSVYNMAYIDADHVYAYGGGYGNYSGSIGAYLAQINPDTLDSIWYTQLTDTETSGEWDYPGVLGILNDGYLYVVYGYRLSKVDPLTGVVVTTLELPTGEALPGDTSYDGFNATTNGILVMKTIYRQAGCGIQGPDALINCPDPTDVPDSILVSVNPQTMELIDQVTLPTTIFSRVTVGQFNSQNYAYLFGSTSFLRYTVSTTGTLVLDSTWNPGTLLLPDQTPGNALVILNDWVIAQTNATPSTTALSVIAVNQGDASQSFSLQPFLGDPIPPLIAAAFSPNISWMPSPVSVDAENNLIYVMDAVPGKIAALSLSETELELVWKEDQMTTESIAIIGSQDERVIVGTDIPNPQIPGNNTNDYAVWRNGATGQEIARSPLLPQITPGSMIQPYYSGNMFYPGVLGSLYELEPTSN